MNTTGEDIETFIIVHRAELVLLCEREGRFSRLPSYQYVFVGSHDTSALKHLDNVVVARELADNIEEFPNLLSFTGWYAIAKNGLATTRWITLLEYDVHLADDFSSKTLRALKAKPSLAGYVSFPLSHPMYLHATPWLIPALQRVHGVNTFQIVHEHLGRGGADEWTSTTNVSLSTNDFHSFVDWFIPVSRLIRHDPIGCHVQERTFPVFCLLFGLENPVIRNVLEHEQVRSHNILARSWDMARREAVRFDRKYAESRRQENKIDQAQVPEALRTLIPLAEKWGLGDEMARGYFLARATRKDKAELRSVMRSYADRILSWLDSLGHEETFSPEAECFLYLLESCSKLGLRISRTYRRNRTPHS